MEVRDIEVILHFLKLEFLFGTVFVAYSLVSAEILGRTEESILDSIYGVDLLYIKPHLKIIY